MGGDLWSPGQDARGLLDAFADDGVAWRNCLEMLATMEVRLRQVPHHPHKAKAPP